MPDDRGPAQFPESPIVPAGPEPYVCDQFRGINTATTRPGVDDKQMWTCDGFYPLEPYNLRTLPGAGPAVWTAPTSTVVLYEFANIGTTAYAIVFLADGSIWAVNTATGTGTEIAVAGTITGPSQLTVGVSQWGSQYVLIVNTPFVGTLPSPGTTFNGYYIWDGTLLYQAGTLAPTVTLTDVGSGYTSVPTVTVSGGAGSGAVLAASIANGSVTSISIVKPGSGWLATDTVAVTISGGQTSGTGGSLTAVLMQATGGSGASLTPVFTVGPYGAYNITSVTITSGGSGYSQFAVATVTGAHGSGYNATLTLTVTGGVVTAVTISNGGSYSSPSATITVTDPGGYYVSSVTVNSGGSGYSPSAVATCSVGGSPVTQATLALNLTAGVITSVTVVNGGQYGSNTPPTVTVTDSDTAATATASLMPYNLYGNAIETYNGAVWIANGNNIYYTAPGSVFNIATSAGGGSFQSSDSFLRVGYVGLVQTNGFLYLIGDSSVNYISGVQTSGSPPTTTFTNQNADPEVGTSWPSTIGVWGQNVIFANTWGAQVSYGSRVAKISKPLDGIYTSGTLGSFQPSAAKANVFSRKIWMLLLPVVDPVTQAGVNKLLIWDGEIWFTSQQNVSLVYIATQEVGSVLTAWGTDGTHLYRLFQSPSVGFSKYLQSKLWGTPGGPLNVKALSRLWGLFLYNSASGSTLTFELDNEGGSQTGVTVNASVSTGVITVVPPTAIGQTGTLLGFTMTTTAADVSVIMTALAAEVVGYRG